MSAAPAVRRLGAGDIAGYRALNALFAAAFEDPESYAAHRPGDAWAGDLLAKPHILLLVAESDGAVIGGLAAYELEKYEQERREFYIYDLAVADTHRRQGVATALIEALRAQARSRGVWAIFVQADYVDPPAIALYEKLGAREEVLHFDIAP